MYPKKLSNTSILFINNGQEFKWQFFHAFHAEFHYRNMLYASVLNISPHAVFLQTLHKYDLHYAKTERANGSDIITMEDPINAIRYTVPSHLRLKEDVDSLQAYAILRYMLDALPVFIQESKKGPICAYTNNNKLYLSVNSVKTVHVPNMYMQEYLNIIIELAGIEANTHVEHGKCLLCKYYMPVLSPVAPR